ncbi:MAG: alkaline phosphatase [Alphaproteobacteria bacterium]|nr:alkaline phosphatase [Alphaproteobacteria bacterium]
MFFNIDIIIVAVFLTLNLICGLLSGYGIRNIREYAIGNKNFSTATIVAAIAATWIGGSNFSITVAETHKQGIFFLICSLAEAVSFWLIAYFYAPRMAEFLGKLSIAEAMNDIYKNRYIRGIIAIFSTVPAIGRIAMQFLVLHSLLSLWLGMPGVYATTLSSLIIIIYSTFGGIKSVTFTDIIQFFTFGVVTPMVAFLIWKSFDSNEPVITAIITDPILNYSLVSDSQKEVINDTLYLCLFLMIPLLDPAIFQRISMAKSTSQVSKSFIIAIFFILLCDALVHTIIGVLFRADPNITDINADNVIQYILDHYLTYGLKGAFVVGIMAMVMSTADSYINSSSVLLSYDFIRSTGINLTEKKELFLARIFSLFVGVIALGVSLFAENLLELLLSVYSFYMPVVTVPFTLAIFGFRSSARAVLIGMVAGFVTVLYFLMFSSEYNIIPGIPGTLVSLAFFIGSHYIFGEKGGWVGIKDVRPLERVRLERKRKVTNFLHSLKTFNFTSFCKNNTPKEERIMVYFGLFCIIMVFSSAYSLPKSLHQKYESILYFIYYSVLVLSTIFITYTFWLKKFKNEIFISTLWNIAVFYNLAFCASLLAIIGQFSQVQLAILITSLVTISILMYWQAALLMIIGGVILSIIYYKIYIDINLVGDYMNNLQFIITYSLLLVSTILIAFLKPKQQYQELTEDNNAFLSNKVDDQKKELTKLYEIKNELLRNLEHETRTPIVGITSLGQVLSDNYDKFNEEQRRKAIKDIADSSERLTSLVNNLIDLSKFNNASYELNKKEVNLSELVHERLELCKKLYVQGKDKENLWFNLQIEDKLIALCDEYYISRTIDNIIVNAIQYSPQGTITIELKSEKNNAIVFSVKDEGIGIPKEELLEIFDPFTVGSNTKTPAGGRGIGLALAKKVISEHNGKIWAKQNQGKGVTVAFSLSI